MAAHALISSLLCLLGIIAVSLCLALNTWQVHETGTLLVHYGLFKNCTTLKSHGNKQCVTLIENVSNNDVVGTRLLVVRVLMCEALVFLVLALATWVTKETCMKRYRVLGVITVVLTVLAGCSVVVGCIVYSTLGTEPGYSYGMAFLFALIACLLSLLTATMVTFSTCRASSDQDCNTSEDSIRQST